eukprot:15101202-Alexandrium_andersonii.AAC.1
MCFAPNTSEGCWWAVLAPEVHVDDAAIPGLAQDISRTQSLLRVASHDVRRLCHRPRCCCLLSEVDK